jgi:hypothetical protein
VKAEAILNGKAPQTQAVLPAEYPRPKPIEKSSSLAEEAVDRSVKILTLSCEDNSIEASILDMMKNNMTSIITESSCKYT